MKLNGFFISFDPLIFYNHPLTFAVKKDKAGINLSSIAELISIFIYIWISIYLDI